MFRRIPLSFEPCARTTMVLALVLVASSSQFLDPSFFAEHNNSCFLTGLPPSQPAGINFCTAFAQQSCCPPASDTSIESNYYSVLPQGPGCGPSKGSVRAVYFALRKLLCLPCDPMEPRYRFQSALGDTAEGGVVPADPNADNATYTWRICRTFLYGRRHGALRRGLWGSNGTLYSGCGVNLNSCPQIRTFNTSSKEYFPALDPSCSPTTDLVIPAVAFADHDDPALSMLSFLSPPLNGFQMVVVDDEDPDFDMSSTPCFGADTTSSAAMVSMLVSVMVPLLFATAVSV